MKKVGLVFVILVCTLVLSINAFAVSVTSFYYAGNDKDLPASLELSPLSLKIDPPVSGQYWSEDGEFHVQVTFSEDGKFVDFTSLNPDYKIANVFVKGGPGGNLYTYNPATLAGTKLRAPDNKGGKQAAISHITFYYVYQPEQTDDDDTPIGWDKSSLKFLPEQAGVTNTGIYAVIENHGSGNMSSTLVYEVYYSTSGNPKNGTAVYTGVIPKLASGQSTTLTFNSTHPGKYMFKAYQQTGHPGTGVLWSGEITVK